jgi:glycerate 2-kinase
MRVVIAPDSFKGSLDARTVARAIADGWRDVRPGDILTLLPQADGGEGTLDAIEAAVAGAVRHESGPVAGPDLRPTPGVWLELPGRIAVVELAQMCGLPLMAEPDPLGATTVGLGEVIRDALAHEVNAVVIGLGGSASTDGGAGALGALGLVLQDAAGAALTPGGGTLGDARAVDRRELVPPPPAGVTLLTDVSAPLLGPTGAAAVFGPQKGADTTQVALLDAALENFAALLGGDPTQPGMGAAGGCGYGFCAAWGAQIEPGSSYIARLSGLPDAVAAADVVLTGEGRFDATSGTGKVVGELLSLARRHGVPAGIIAGQVAESPDDVWTAAIADLADSIADAVAHPEPLLRRAGAAAARHFGRGHADS